MIEAARPETKVRDLRRFGYDMMVRDYRVLCTMDAHVVMVYDPHKGERMKCAAQIPMQLSANHSGSISVPTKAFEVLSNASLKGHFELRASGIFFSEISDATHLYLTIA